MCQELLVCQTVKEGNRGGYNGSGVNYSDTRTNYRPVDVEFAIIIRTRQRRPWK